MTLCARPMIKMNARPHNEFIINIISCYTLLTEVIKWQKEFDDLVKVDYDKYNNETDLRLTMDQQILMYKYQRVDELFRQKKADERDNIDRENQKSKYKYRFNFFIYNFFYKINPDSLISISRSIENMGTKSA